MGKKFRQSANYDKLMAERPVEFIPDWFRVSPSMIAYAYDECGEKLVYKYVNGAKPMKDGASLPRTMAFRHVIDNKNYRRYVTEINGKGSTDHPIMLGINYYFYYEAKSISEELEIEKMGPRNLQDIEKIMRMIGWKFDYNEKIPNYSVMISQIFNAALHTRDFLEMHQVEPLLDPDPEVKNPEPVIQKRIHVPMVWAGEILDETHNKPTEINVTLPYVTNNLDIMIWKIADKRMNNKNMAAYTSDEGTAFAIGLRQYLIERGISPPPVFKIIIKRIIVNDKGSFVTIEDHVRDITTEDMYEVMCKYVDAAKRIKSMKLFKRKGNHCNWCDYKDSCFSKDASKLIIFDEIKVEKRDTNNNDDEPF
jgi:hypothetical protein